MPQLLAISPRFRVKHPSARAPPGNRLGGAIPGRIGAVMARFRKLRRSAVGRGGYHAPPCFIGPERLPAAFNPHQHVTGRAVRHAARAAAHRQSRRPGAGARCCSRRRRGIRGPEAIAGAAWRSGHCEIEACVVTQASIAFRGGQPRKECCTSLMNSGRVSAESFLRRKFHCLMKYASLCVSWNKRSPFQRNLLDDASLRWRQ